LEGEGREGGEGEGREEKGKGGREKGKVGRGRLDDVNDMHSALCTLQISRQML